MVCDEYVFKECDHISFFVLDFLMFLLYKGDLNMLMFHFIDQGVE